MGVFGPDADKIRRWAAEGKISRIRSAIEEGGEIGELAQRTLAEIASDPTRFAGVTDHHVLEAFGALLDLDQRAASEALLAYCERPTASGTLATTMIDRLAARGSDAALMTMLRLAGNRAGKIAAAAVRVLGTMDHPNLLPALQSAILLVDSAALQHLLEVLETRRVPGAAEALLKRFADARPDLRKPIAHALHRQGFTATNCPDAGARLYLLVEEGRYADAAAAGPAAWAPLAEALGANPVADARTQEILRALGAVDRNRIDQALRLKLLKAVSVAADKPSAQSYRDAHAVAEWTLPAWTKVARRSEEAERVGELIRDEKFRAARAILETA